MAPAFLAAAAGGEAAACPLSALGPVLLVGRRPPVHGVPATSARDWRVRIDCEGCDESFLLAGEWRVFRLPDTDYLGWQRLVDALAPQAETPERRALPWLRRAWVVRFAGSRAVGQRRLSLAGALRAAELARRERARLASAGFRDGTAMPTAPPPWRR